jgi:transposase
MSRPPLPATLPEAHALIEALWARLEALEAKVDGLQRQVGRNSTNSSKPPSSDGPKVERPKRPGTGRKRGGQPGHEGSTRALIDDPDRVVECKPSRCGGCGERLSGTDPEPSRHQVTDVPPVRPHVTEYRTHALTCRGCGLATRGAWPAGVDGRAFGPRVTAMVAWLAGSFGLSHRDIVDLLGDGFGVTMATGSVAACERAASGAVREPVEALAAAVEGSAVAHADETGWRHQNERAWLWVAVTEVGTLFVEHDERSHLASRALLGEAFEGYLVSDRWSAYEGYALARRQVCWAHLVRQFGAMSEAAGEMGVLGAALCEQADALFHVWRRFERERLGRATLARWMAPVRAEVPALLARGAALGHALSGRCREILRLAGALFTFVEVEGVGPTNNAAERAIRKAVLWRKGSYGTQSLGGRLFVGRILSVVATLRQQGRKVLGYLVEACQARLVGEAAPSLLPSPVAQPP